MSEDYKDKAFLAYKNDSRIPCRYGAKCYQKNSLHHNKYKHPFSTKKKEAKVSQKTLIGNKRKFEEINDNKKEADSVSVSSKIQKVKTNVPNADVNNSEHTDNIETDNEHLITTSNNEKMVEDNIEEIKEKSCTSLDNSNQTDSDDSCIILSPNCMKESIKNLFLVQMPEDFYQFYEFCKLISKNAALRALKSVHLNLVGPFDILDNKLKSFKNKDKEKYLGHWRYYYDPPEFQTIITGEKDGLHLGYWRDEPNEKPIFVVKNKADVNCIIQPEAENVFGAVNVCIEDALKTANLFEKTSILQLQKQLKEFAQKHNITLESKTDKMINREKKVVARTFHKAGIVVPYNKKTQLGYRELSVTDKELQQIFKKIDEANSLEERKKAMSKLDEVVRLATIAADECDFGTCLELAHDLFSSGNVHIEKTALQMFSIAYTHLNRPEFLEIIKVHLKNRKRGNDLTVI
ncbi:histone PARylation factor 1 [Vespa crabro]|uniref:histone PARylation factor 1 n=1 Tax=Vespa crabro TaxID=7445 RepID=UPI001EFFB7AC|nr:histone PARylation factor 1 [Vespa crabro]